MRARLLIATAFIFAAVRSDAGEPAPSPCPSPTPALLPCCPTTPCEPKVDCCPPSSCDMCCNRPRLFGSVEYLLYWFENQRVPPLVVIAPRGTPLGNPAGAPAEIALFGGDRTDFGGINAMRVTAGYWLDPQQNYGVEASGFLTEQAGQLLGAGHDGAATSAVLLGRTNGTLAIVAPVGVPGVLTGGVVASQHTRLWGAEASGVLNWSETCRWRTDLLGGFRYLDLDESLDVQDFSRSVLIPAAQTARTDSFDGRTQFWGGQVGARSTVAWGQATLSLIGKVGLGVSHLSVDREGQTALPGAVLPTGVLVTSANAGHDTTNRFAGLSETTIQIGYQWTRCIQTTVGYNFLYLTSSARVGDQVQPVGGINATDFYANGITFGLSCRY